MRTRAERRENFFKKRGNNTSVALNRRRPKASRRQRGDGFEKVVYKFRRDTIGDELQLFVGKTQKPKTGGRRSF